MRNKFIKIEQRLQLIEKLPKSNNISYIAKNSKKRSRENWFLYEQDNSFSATNDAKNSITSITKIIVITQIRSSVSNN